MGSSQGLTGIIYRAYNRFFGRGKVYSEFIKNKEPKGSLLLAQSREVFSYNPKFSVVIPLYETNPRFLEELLLSFLNQTYKNFELCISDASSFEEVEVHKEICEKYSGLGLSVNFIPLDKNLGISGNTNRAIEEATGEFVVFCDHDDTVAADTLYSMARALNEDPTLDGFYSEQDYLTENGKRRVLPVFKPDLDMELLRNCNYITHIFAVRKTVVDAVGMLDSKMDGSQDYDFILRVLEYTKNIRHIPKVLYHWRLSSDSTSANPESKAYAYDAGKEALASHFRRQNIEFEKIEYKSEIGRYHTSYAIAGNPLVSLVAGDSELGVTEAFKSQSYKNYEVVKDPKEARGDYLLFLGEKIFPGNLDFIKELLYFAQREDVGAVAPRIDGRDGKILSAGKVFGIGGFIGEGLFGTLVNSNAGLWWGCSIRNISAAGFSALMTRRDLYFSNLPEDKMGDFKDIDYCLTLRKKGKSILFNPFSRALFRGKAKHPEKSLGKDELILKWGEKLKEPDPYYNINFKKDRANYIL